MKQTTLFLSLLFICQSVIAQVKKAPAPNWVETIEYSLDPEVNLDDLTQGTITLLYDHQVHVPKAVSYTQFVTKIFDNVGIQEASSISVDYDPSYQTLKFHSVTINRDGEIIDKFQSDNFQLMRRETNAENHLYDGSMSAVLNISDVRTNDIIEYSYSIAGFNPIHKGKFSDVYYLDSYVPVGKIAVTIFSDSELNYKGINNPEVPNIKKMNGLYQYVWVNENTEKVLFEDYSPSWKLDYQTVFVSNYDSWESVVNWGIKTYTINEKPSADLLKKIKNIVSENKTKGEKIKATLNFVQNDIRYLGLEDGIGAYKPFTPNKVFKQRFGDCKDKSLLMTTMLNNMGIEAYPMLVNTTLKETITEFLPSPVFFDHCVVKVIDVAGKGLYYDPTITNQGGSYKTTYFPDYQYGLVLAPETTDFDQIFSDSENKIEIYDEYSLEAIGKGATLKVTSTYYDSEADAMRSYFKNNSINAIAKEYADYYSNYYFNIEATKKPEYQDNVEDNKFQVTEAYKIDSLWRPMTEKKGYISAHFSPSTIEGLLYVPTKEERKDPLSLYFPSTKEHRIKIKLQSPWDIKREKLEINFSGFQYKWNVDYDSTKKEIDLRYFLKTQKDHISVKEFKEYTREVKKMNETLGYQIFTPGTLANGKHATNAFEIGDAFKNGFKLFLKIAVGLIFIVILILFLAWYIPKSRNKNQ
ncbi:DUF3857 domain-containing transglutaminase family protein [Lacinutrix sp. Hel_I_90]|uniref:DUF3857 domain-containing transglutaminase family protein n=1 Tax=Lacinutrix sp. Hel_I_90 TaxID=1249999 RepID=UPI0005C9A896|nr:DUF3857 domain-containing protein [Lacinutrix sp. Hel_I_90]